MLSELNITGKTEIKEFFLGRFRRKDSYLSVWEEFLFEKRLLGKLASCKTWSLVITSTKISPVSVFSSASSMKKKIPIANKWHIAIRYHTYFLYLFPNLSGSCLGMLFSKIISFWSLVSCWIILKCSRSWVLCCPETVNTTKLLYLQCYGWSIPEHLWVISILCSI